MKRLLMASSLALSLALAAGALQAAVFSAGETVVRNGLAVQGIYIQEVKMTGEHAAHGNHGGHGGSGHGHDMPGMHLEAVVKMAEEGHGFPVGSWVPYLDVHYTLTRKGGDWSSEGPLVPMLANDGPHYGANVAMPGPGKYVLTFRIAPPSEDVFPRHFDRELGDFDEATRLMEEHIELVQRNTTERIAGSTPVASGEPTSASARRAATDRPRPAPSQRPGRMLSTGNPHRPRLRCRAMRSRVWYSKGASGRATAQPLLSR